jgi:hypothetical protein
MLNIGEYEPRNRLTRKAFLTSALNHVARWPRLSRISPAVNPPGLGHATYMMKPGCVFTVGASCVNAWS